MEKFQGHKQELLKQKKLILLLDLDHTVMHATCDNDFGDINQIVEAKKKIPILQSNIHQFEAGGRTYFVKLRPKAKEFIENISEFFEINVYTASERGYANQIIKLLDPEGKFIGTRALTRTESPDMTKKFVERLFPFSVELVVIVDDSVHAWVHDKGQFHMFKIPRFYFFIPKKQQDKNRKKKEEQQTEKEEEEKLKEIHKELENVTFVNERWPKLKWINFKSWNDEELKFCEHALKATRNLFYSQPPGESLSVNHVLNVVREKVLENVNILFSSVVPGDIQW